MARSRNIKPGFFCNEGLADIKPHGRLLFIGLWTLADKDGLLEYRERKIKAQLFPYESVQVEKLLDDLIQGDFINVYEVDGQKYIVVKNWDRHQNPHKNEKESVLPKPNKFIKLNDVRDNIGLSTDKIGQARVITPDSLNLIPDSLNPSSTMSGKPDYTHSAKEVINLLNEKAGRNYQPTGVNIEIITARMKEGATEDQLRQVVVMKTREWIGEEEMCKYLRPATLFNRTKFSQYVGELGKRSPV